MFSQFQLHMCKISNSIHPLGLLAFLTCVTISCCSLKLVKKVLSFHYANFSIKARVTQSSFHCINNSFIVICFQNIIKNIMKNFFQILLLPLWPSARKEEVYLPCQCFYCKTVYFTKQKSMELQLWKDILEDTLIRNYNPRMW